MFFQRRHTNGQQVYLWIFLCKLPDKVFSHFVVGHTFSFFLIVKCSYIFRRLAYSVMYVAYIFPPSLSFALCLFHVEFFNFYVITLPIIFLWLLGFEIPMFLVALFRLYFFWLNFFPPIHFDTRNELPIHFC